MIPAMLTSARLHVLQSAQYILDTPLVNRVSRLFRPVKARVRPPRIEVYPVVSTVCVIHTLYTRITPYGSQSLGSFRFTRFDRCSPDSDGASRHEFHGSILFVTKHDAWVACAPTQTVAQPIPSPGIEPTRSTGRFQCYALRYVSVDGLLEA